MTRSTWGKAVAHRIGIGGQIEYDTARVGLTLHVPCSRGKHLVDVLVEPGAHPDLVVKRMLSKGWVVGTRISCPDCGRKKKDSKMTGKTENVVPIKDDAQPSDQAKRAHRLVMMALEDLFDEAQGAYRSGYSDAKIAEETGASEKHVCETREKYFGALAEPNELVLLRADLEGSKASIAEFAGTAMRRIEAIENRLSNICAKNGWL